MDDTVSIRPMTLGEILDKAIRLYRQNFFKFIVILATSYIPTILISMGFIKYQQQFLKHDYSLTNNYNTFDDILSFLIYGGIVILAIILVGGFGTAALTRAIVNAYMGYPIGILESYWEIKGTVWKQISALMIALFFAFFLTSVVNLFPIVGWLCGLGPLIYITMTFIPFLSPIAMLENLNTRKTLRRAWDLSRTRFWWLLGCAFILAFLGQWIVFGPTLIIYYLFSLSISFFKFNVKAQVDIENTLIISTMLMLYLLYSLLKSTFMTVIYFDLRIRNEGLDLALQLNTSHDKQEEFLAADTIHQPNTPLITWVDIGRFLLIPLCFISFCFMSYFLLYLLSNFLIGI